MKKYTNTLLLLIAIILSFLTISILNKEIIPVHFNNLGVVDRYGSKFELLIMPAIYLVIYLIINVIQYHVIRKNNLLFNFLSFELLLLVNILFIVIYINLIFIVNFNYEKFLIDISYSCSCFFSYFILHFGIKLKNLVIYMENEKEQMKPFFNLSIFIFVFSILINILFINKAIVLPIILFIYVISFIFTSIYIKNR